jgi:hypothetical protein
MSWGYLRYKGTELEDLELEFRAANQQKEKGHAVCGTFDTFYWVCDKILKGGLDDWWK